MNTIFCKSINNLPSIAKSLMQTHSNARIFAINGQMGAGKTTFIKTLCTELGCNEPVTSPTFAIVNEYKTNLGETIYHFDFYRLKNSKEALNIGFEEYIYNGAYCFMEWSEIVNDIMPDNYVTVNIEVDEINNTRIFSF